MLNKDTCVPLYTQQDVDAAVERLALEINRDYRGRDLLVIGVLKGAFIFLADLVRKLDLPVEVDFVRLSSYGSGRSTSGVVRVLLKPSSNLEGRDVLIVDDIIDTGLSISHLIRYLKRRRVASVRVCALADKPSRRRVEVKVDYRGFEVPDRFLVGCGMDWDERYRNLPNICALENGQ